MPNVHYSSDDFKKEIVVEELDPSLVTDELMKEFENSGFNVSETVPMDIEDLFDGSETVPMDIEDLFSQVRITDK